MAYSCSACGKQFYTEWALTCHLWSKEKCRENLGLAQLKAFESEKDAWLARKPFSCNGCGKTFATENALEAHAFGCGKTEQELLAAYEDWTPFVCHCGKRFAKKVGKGGLDNHKAAYD